MFRKYYKDANSDLKPREELLDELLLLSREQKSFPAKKQYYGYIASAAAAVLIITAAVSLPAWEKNDGGVVFEETTVSTAAPKSSEDKSASENADTVTSREQTADTKTANTETSDTRAQNTRAASTGSSSAMPKRTENKEAAEQTHIERKAESGTENEDMIAENDSESKQQTKGTAFMSAAVDLGDTESRKFKVSVNNAPELADTENFSVSSAAPSVASGGALQDSVSLDTGNAYKEEVIISGADILNLTPPSGYSTSYSGAGEQRFVKDNSEIYVSAYPTEDADSAAVYTQNDSDINAELTKSGIQYSVYAFNASMDTVEELVNSI